jgi:hypothetical protein
VSRSRYRSLSHAERITGERNFVIEELKSVIGKAFLNPRNNVEYGPIRLEDPAVRFSTLDGSEYAAFASDCCGNHFTTLADGSVWLWDHETDDLDKIADSISEFSQRCAVTEPVKLTEDQVSSAWVDPVFAKSIGMNVPEDGWVKRKKDKEHKC